MGRSWAVILVLACGAGSAAADRLVLTDGRVFVGSVTDGEVVIVSDQAGSRRFAPADVARIETRRELEDQLKQQLEAVPTDDANALLAAALWAAEAGLGEQAWELAADLLRLDPDCPQAHRLLGRVLMDGQWLDPAEALEQARQWLTAGRCEELLDRVLPEIIAAAEGRPGPIQAARRAQGQAELAAERYDAAETTFRQLSETAPPPAALRFAAIAEIIAESDEGILPEGPLSDSAVLEQALLARAETLVAAALERMADPPSDEPDKALARLELANEEFDHADALVPGISRPHRIEVARQEIEWFRQAVEARSALFDKEVDSLGQADMSPAEWREQLDRMILQLDDVSAGLEQILIIARTCRRDLPQEIRWAQEDLQRIRIARQALALERDAAF